MNSMLRDDVFKPNIEQVPIRQGYGEGLVLAGEQDTQVVALCADLTESTKTNLFAKKFPDRFFEVGITEQNMASVGSGMAAMGKIPFIASYAMFNPGRNWEQIRTTICYNDANVKIVGAHAGISVGPDGGTHQAVEDIALTRVVPNMTVLVPCDAIEARKATLAAAKYKGPVYIRLAREKTPVITKEDTPFEIGKAEVFYESKKDTPKKVAFLACGSLVYNALVAAHMLENEGFCTTVINIATIKPLDKETILAVAKKYNALVTVEEHQIAGGLGSAVSEFLASVYPTAIEFIGVKDKFGQSGKPSELIEHYEMGVSHIKKAALLVVQKRINR